MDNLETKCFCDTCKDCIIKDGQMICGYEESNFYGNNVAGILLSPCHSKWGRPIENKED